MKRPDQQHRRAAATVTPGEVIAEGISIAVRRKRRARRRMRHRHMLRDQAEREYALADAIEAAIRKGAE